MSIEASWEKEDSDEELKGFEAESEDDLLNKIEQEYYGGYYNIWYVIASRKNPAKSVPILLKALTKIEAKRVSSHDDLNAINCVRAICELLEIKDEILVNRLVFASCEESMQILQKLYAEKFE